MEESQQHIAQIERSNQSFRKLALKKLRNNRLAMLALRFVLFLAMVAIFADFLAYRKPLVCKMDGELYFPVFNDYLQDWGMYQWEADLHFADWRKMDLEWAVWPPVRYSPEEIDYANNRPRSPFFKQKVKHWQEWHYLGTNNDGRDILSGLIHGTRISLTIGFVAMGISLLIGIIMGSLAGYWGDNRLQISVAGIIFACIGGVLGIFYGFQVRQTALLGALEKGPLSLLLNIAISLGILIGITALFIWLSKPLNRIGFLGKKKFVWVDILISRLIEIVGSVPAILLIITLMALTQKRSIYTIMVIIGLVSWPTVARFMRAEMLRARSMEYILAARSLGFREIRIMFRHAVPNSIAPALVVMAFGVAGAIALEAGLSFLGIGVPDNIVTWGGLLRESRSDISAWWLSLFPGLAMFLTITALNLLGEGLRDALDPRVLEE